MNLNILFYLENLCGNVRNPDQAFRILLSDFNARSKSCWVQNIANNEGTQTESVSSLDGFSQYQNQHTASKINHPALA